MDQNPEQPIDSSSSGMNRRKFISAVGAAAVTSTAFLHEMGQAQGGTPLYQDSFGNIAPVSRSLIALGINPPPIPSLNQQGAPEVEHRGHALASHRHGYVPKAGPDTTPGPPAGYTPYNILLIMVDQLRAPRWLPPGGQAAIDGLLTNITALRNQSFVFLNYYVAATACSPSRASLLTGLYTQQTCFFQTQGDSTTCQPNLQTGFPNIATVLSQTAPSGPQLGYNCTWIGKWHLSDPVQGGMTSGDNGPLDYGFAASAMAPNLPPNNSLPSSNVGGNLGNLGYNPNQSRGWFPTHSTTLPLACGTGGTGCSGTSPTCTCLQTAPQYNDAAICDWFLTTWIPNIPPAPWFVAVSFVNPHDITQFPFSFNLAGTTGFGTTPPSNFPGYLFYPPLLAGSPGVVGPGGPIEFADTALPPLSNASLYPATGPAPANYMDSPATHPYDAGVGKPDIQAIYQTSIANKYGTADDTVSSWCMFLNYYLWMQSCVDVQVGRVLSAVSTLAEQPVIIFVSDHGEYGGSHDLHAKGGALYDESLNVPLYISFPSMRSTPTSATINFACSSVDILPFLYALGLGSDFYWRLGSSDIISYLKNRESIFDAIMKYAPGAENTTANQRRLSGISNSGGAASQAGQYNQPYILHTTDEFGNEPPGVATHAVAFRTIDLTVVNTTVGNPLFNPANGGAKLGIYSQWPAPNPHITSPTQTQPLTSGQQFEFYDYTGTMNFGETGNEYKTNAEAATYITQFNSSAVQGELYLTLPTSLQPTYVAALTGYQNAQTMSVCTSSEALPTEDE